MAGITHVIHCAGCTKAQRISEFHQTNEIGTRNVVAAANTQVTSMQRFVHISSLAAVGPAIPDKPARESDTPRPVSAYGKSKLAAELEVHVYIHTWLKVGGTPRLPGGDNLPSESTPMDVAKLAQRFPQVAIICGHSGGDWELGVRAVRAYKNVLLEFAGSDPHSGMVDYAIRELGVDRLVWGGHGPSRSYATEMGKVLDADISKADRMKIFGGNLRRICAPIFRKKGIKIAV